MIGQIDQALAAGDANQALRLLAQALTGAGPAAALFHRQGLALIQLGRPQEAVQSFNQGLHRDALSVDMRLGLARACLALGDGWSATAWLSDACRVAPEQPGLWLELASLLASQGREPEVQRALQTALTLHSGHADLSLACTESLMRLGHFEAALKACHVVHPPGPHERTLRMHQAFCLEQLLRLDEAVAGYRRVTQDWPEFAQAHVNLAGVLWRVGQFEEALEAARRAVALAPASAAALRMLGTTLMHLNRLPEAEHPLRRALERQPGMVAANLDLAMLLLLSGRYVDGWQAYAGRWADAARMRRPDFFQPEREWQGPRVHPPAGRVIVVYAEQGLGDVIQFLRYVLRLQAAGATVYAWLPQALVSLAEHSLPGLLCLGPGRHLSADWHVALLDLPRHFDPWPDTGESQAAYLQAPPGKRALWAQRLGPRDGHARTGRLRVGLAWAGHDIHPNHHNRSLSLSLWQGLLAHSQVQCFSLQKSVDAVFTDRPVGGADLPDFTPLWQDFSDSAAMLEELDLVITVDSAVAHLAGALGRPVWVLLPPNPDWRWGLEGEHTPWYAGMRLFRRSHGEPLPLQIQRVMAALDQRLSARSG